MPYERTRFRWHSQRPPSDALPGSPPDRFRHHERRAGRLLESDRKFQQRVASPDKIRRELTSTDGRHEMAARRQTAARRGALVGALAAWTVGALAIGVTGGYFVFNRYAVHSESDVVVTPQGPTTDSADRPAVVMPDVEGLSRPGALEALADIGLDPGLVHFEDREYAATAGTVVGQTPARGTRDPNAVTLAVAVPVKVPNLKGRQSAVAITTLEALGAQIRVVQAYDPAEPVDRVISTQPAAGEQLGLEIVLRVSAAPSSVFLSTLNPLTSNCRTGSAKAGGKDLNQSITCTVGSGTNPRPATADYTLSGRADGLVATVGISDDSVTGSTANVRVLGDGRPLGTVDVSFGQTKSLEASTAGVIRLQFEVSGSPNVRVVLGDARLIGSPDGISSLQARR